MTSAPVTDTVGRAVIETVASYGVDTVFGIPGTHNLELYRPLDEFGIRAVTTRHEQGAGYGADGWAQQTGLPGVVITTSGPGLQNAMSAIGTAYCESRPMLVISPGVPRGQDGADVGTLHETKNATGMVDAIALWSRRVDTAEEAVAAVHDAFAVFRTARPRPVHIEIPLDLLESEAGVPPAERRARADAAPAAGDRAAVASAAALLAACERPVILAGGGSTGAVTELTSLAERLGAPVITSLNGKGVLDENHPLALGSQLRIAAARAVAEQADVLLVVGSKLGEAELWVDRLRPTGRVIRVDIDATRLGVNLEPEVGITGDAAAVLAALAEALPTVTARQPDLAAVRDDIAAEIRAASPDNVVLAELILAGIPDDAIIAGDSSQIVYLAAANLQRAATPHSLLYTPTYATLGYGLPAAIGARVAQTERPVVTIIGDGALMFCVNELVTALEQGLDVTVVCVDNGGYAEIKQNEIERGMTPIGVDLRQPDWVALARAFGAQATAVTASADIPAAVAAAITAGGVHLVHIPQTALHA